MFELNLTWSFLRELSVHLLVFIVVEITQDEKQ